MAPFSPKAHSPRRPASIALALLVGLASFLTVVVGPTVPAAQAETGTPAPVGGTVAGGYVGPTTMVRKAASPTSTARAIETGRRGE